MKSFDFTKTGGFPLTQNRLDYLQSAWAEMLTALAAVGSNTAANIATVMTGMVSSTVLGTTTVSAGWFVYNGVPIRFPVQTYGAVGGGNAMYVVITPTDVPLPVSFFDGSTPNVAKDVTGVLTQLVNTTPTDATHFLLSAIVPWSESAWANISSFGAVGGYSAVDHGAPYFATSCKVNDGNEVSLAGAVDVVVPAPGTFTLFTLPANAWPSNQCLVTAKTKTLALNGSVTSVFLTLYISTAGVVSFDYGGSSTTGTIYLDGITFRLN